MRPLAAIVKANDLRGPVPQAWGRDEACAIGAALPQLLDGAKAIYLGRDCRLSGPGLAAALTDGLTSQGVDVIDLGMVSTDAVYYASGAHSLPGVVLTASHNPPGENGLKLMQPGAKPIGRDNGLSRLVELAEQNPTPPPAGQPGWVRQLDIWPAFASYLRSVVDLATIRPLKVVADAGNGLGGIVTQAVLGQGAGLEPLPVELVPLFGEPDGRFPNHPANPIDPANLVDLQRAVVANGADLGLAFDGDADRCFVVDEAGQAVTASAIGTMIAVSLVAQEKAAGREAVIVHNAITSRALPEMVEAAGGHLVRTPVGHALIKPVMASQDAVFGAEHSGHYYFRDFFYADTGILTAMHVLALLGRSQEPMSQLAARFDPYAASGEINFKVADPAGAIERVLNHFATTIASGEIAVDRLDGVTLDHWHGPEKWWANIRPSNTETILRLNVEAKKPEMMAQLRVELSKLLEE
ncbi:MAG: phosphomannomutase/phosphoglucomutase [Micrococcales bacterium]|nr:phosphomannomutase/phosphoglucomutase [Micrococcales bacterium]